MSYRQVKRTLLVQDSVGLAFALSIGVVFDQVYLVHFPYTSRMRGRNSEVAYDYLFRYAQKVLDNFKTISINDLEQNLVNNGAGGELFSQLGLLSKHLYSDNFSHYSFFERVSIVSGMADLILSIDKPFTNKFKILELKESRKWQKGMKEVPFDCLYYPKLIKDNLTVLNRPIEHIDKKIFASQVTIAKTATDLPSWFDEIVDSHPHVLIINPYQEVSNAFARALGKLIDSSYIGKRIEILIKPHPSSLSPGTIIKSIEKQISYQTLNTSLGIEADVLPHIPLEFFLVSLASPIVIGSPSSAFFLLNPQQIKLVKKRSGRYFKDSIERANAGPFLRLCVASLPLSYH